MLQYSLIIHIEGPFGTQGEDKLENSDYEMTYL